MKTFQLQGTSRTEVGKKSSRELRKQGLVPCNMYGIQKDENGLPVALPFVVKKDDLRKLIYTPDIYVVDLTIDGKLYNAIINRKKYLDTDLLPGYDHNFLWTVELAGHYQGLRYEAAYIGDNVHFKKTAADPTTKNFGGWYAQAGYLLFGGSQNYDANGGKYTKITRGRKWGDIELCARYEYCDLNYKNVYGGSAEAYTLGLNWQVNNNVKIVVNYQYNNNDRYANGKNKLFVGHDAGGNPTKDYTKVVEGKNKAGVDYHMIGLRFEIDF